MQNHVQPIADAYDLIAAHYDAQWSTHVSKPQSRLTQALELAPGQRCADLGCGTGIDTLEMARLVAPGEVVGVDCSQGMLDAARRRAQAAGFELTTCCQGAEEFIAEADAESFDAISLRFCLGYLDWRKALSRLPRLLRAEGRLGILTILAGSAPQAYDTYRQMANELGVSTVDLTALESREQIEQQLTVAGLRLDASWMHRFRLPFASGELLANWLRTSGIATAAQLSALPAALVDRLWQEFARRVESYREQGSVPLDFQIAGVIAQKPRTS